MGNNDFFSKDQTQTLKGIMILIIFFHHFTLIRTCNPWLYYLFIILTKTSIAMFILIAGYTTALGYYKSGEKPDLKRVWIKRCWRLYLPVMIFSIIQNNFLAALLFYFVLTDIAFLKFKTDRSKLLFIFIGNMFYIFALKLIGAGEWWYDDVLTFFIGVAIVMYKNQLMQLSKKKFWYILIGFLVLSVLINFLIYKCLPYDFLTMAYSTQNTVIVALLMLRVNIKSKVFNLIGKYSWEIFFLHQPYMLLMQKVFNRNILILISALILTMITAVIVNNGIKEIHCRVEKRRIE